MLQNADESVVSIHAASKLSSKRACCTAIAMTAISICVLYARLELKFDAAGVETPNLQRSVNQYIDIQLGNLFCNVLYSVSITDSRLDTLA